MIVVPLLAGFAVRHFFHKYIAKILAVFPAIPATFIIFICSLVIALNKSNLAGITGLTLVACVILNVYGMSAEYGVGTLFSMENRQKRTLSIKVGMQNAGLGTILALEYFGDEAAIRRLFSCSYAE